MSLRNRKRWLALLPMLAILGRGTLSAHPGAAIAVKDGVVYFVDTGSGVYSIEAGGRIVRGDGPAFHWFAFDPSNRFHKTPWPAIPNAEFRSAGMSPTLVLSSDFPVTAGADGRFYYPDGSDGKQVRIVAIEPSGARSVHATLPPIQRAGRTIHWLNGLVAGPGGTLYYTEDRSIRRVDRSGRVSPIAMEVTVTDCAVVPSMETVDAPYLRGLAVAPDGTIYVAASGCGAVLKVDRQRRVRTVLKVEPPWSPTAVAVEGGDLYVLEYLHTASDNRVEWIPRVRKVTSSGRMTILGGIKRR